MIHEFQFQAWYLQQMLVQRAEAMAGNGQTNRLESQCKFNQTSRMCVTLSERLREIVHR